MAVNQTTELNDSNFEAEVINAEGPVLVDFWSESCAPCRALGPVIDQLATEFQGRARIGKLNTESNLSTAVQHSIQFLPTVLIFKNGRVTTKLVGLRPKKELSAALEAALET